MLKRHSQLFEGLLTASDLLVVTVAWILSYLIRFDSGLLPVEKGVPPFTDYLRMSLFLWLIWAFVFRRFGLYRPMRGVRRFKEVLTVIRANSLCVILLMAITYLFREKSVPFSRAVFVIFFFISTTAAVASRTAIRIFLREMRRRGHNLRHVLIVGAGDLAARIVRRFSVHPEYGIELIGCLTDAQSYARTSPFFDEELESKFANSSELSSNGNGLSKLSPKVTEKLHPYLRKRVVGTYDDLSKILGRGGIDQVIVAMPLCDHNKLQEVIRNVGDQMVDVKIVPDIHRFVMVGSLVEEFDGMPVMSLASTPLSGINKFTKRILDLVFGSLFLLLSLPFMLITALLVKITSAGPVFFSQERVGLDGRKFKILKFRTMKIDAEKDGAKFAVKDDPRTTSLGKFLRKFNIDEMPQLINVILGHMSLVGPRPERPVFIQDFRQHIPKYMLRHKVQAGMTGWAQINGWRGNTSIERRIEHDLYYIENWSLALDLKILAMTFVNSFRDQNAY